MRLQAYMITEGRGTYLEWDEAKDYLRKNCKQAVYGYSKGNMIYRGVNGPVWPYGLYKPKGFRVSKNSDNYYTLLISNSPKWKGYPRRDKSFICTTNVRYASKYGNVYGVFPFDNSVIGVVPSQDFWGGFIKSIGTDLSSWSASLETIFKLAGVPLNDDSLSSVLKSFRELDKQYKNGKVTKEKMAEHPITERNYKWFFDNYNGSFLDMMDKLFDPKKNGFKTMKPGGKYPENRECWVSDNCIFVYNDKTIDRDVPMKTLLKDLGYK